MSESYPVNAKLPLHEIESARKHLFLCIGPDCCDPSAHEELWTILKAETKRLRISVLRTKAACLRVCKEGPWLVVYPEGIWYGRLDAARLRRILREHIEEGRYVDEWIAARVPHRSEEDDKRMTRPVQNRSKKLRKKF